MKRLFLIPARGGSKGIPGKNIKLLNGKPLINYSIELAREFADDSDICLSTDDTKIVECASQSGLKVPFLRPVTLSSDEAPMDGVILHAISYYADAANLPDQVILLQPTSPFRQMFHVKEALQEFTENIDMVVSVSNSKSNPYYNIFEEDQQGMLHISKGDGGISTRQKAPPVFIFNGAIYVINVPSFLKCKSLSKLKRIKKYLMEEKYSLDIDDDHDWNRAESLFRSNAQ